MPKAQEAITICSQIPLLRYDRASHSKHDGSVCLPSYAHTPQPPLDKSLFFCYGSFIICYKELRFWLQETRKS